MDTNQNGFEKIGDAHLFAQKVQNVRNVFNTGVTHDLTFREDQLMQLKKMVIECEEVILSALHQDLRKNRFEGLMGDSKPIVTDIDLILNHLREYAADEKLPFNLLAIQDGGYVRKEPFGVVLIIGTWNYPFMSVLQPLVGAIAAGNCAVLKPSEVTPTCAQTMAEIVPQYLDKTCFQVITGDAEDTKNLLKNKFDYIFFTGAPSIGRCIMQAAAVHLTPVTLELGGKCPCFVDSSADFRKTVSRIIWGKGINLGQICVCPDYVLCPEDKVEEFVNIAKAAYKKYYGDNSQESPSLIRLVNKRHFQRLKKLLESTEGTIAVGGQMDEEDLWIEPTIVTNVDPDKDPLMQEEIFGPILPIIPIKSVDDAIRIIRSKTKPLAMYIFCKDKNVTQKLIENTSSGSICINSVFWQAAWMGLPFGGVGESGMGSFHGKSSFDTFSHRRSILHRSITGFSEKLAELTYPPYTDFKFNFMSWVFRNFERCNVTLIGFLITLVSIAFLYWSMND